MRINNSIFNLLDKIFFADKCLGCETVGPELCKKCLATLPAPDRDLPNYVYALYEYRNKIIKKILTDAKYRKRFSGLATFGRVMADAIIDIVSEYTELNNYSRILIIPVPITNKRQRNRGFNQSEIIANEIMKNLSDERFKIEKTIVYKTKDRTPQASIKNRNERLISPVGTFAVKNKEKLQGAFCIIIDDITTTGGTIKEMRRILLESGASRVIGLTIAH